MAPMTRCLVCVLVLVAAGCAVVRASASGAAADNAESSSAQPSNEVPDDEYARGFASALHSVAKYCKKAGCKLPPYLTPAVPSKDDSKAVHKASQELLSGSGPAAAAAHAAAAEEIEQTVKDEKADAQDKKSPPKNEKVTDSSDSGSSATASSTGSSHRFSLRRRTRRARVMPAGGAALANGVCHDPALLNPSYGLVGPPNPANNVAATAATVQVRSEAYQGAKYLHMFWNYGNTPDGGPATDHRCYGAVAVAGTVANGCGPYAARANHLTTFIQCYMGRPNIANFLNNAWDAEDEDILNRLSIIAQQLTPAQWSNNGVRGAAINARDWYEGTFGLALRQELDLQCITALGAGPKAALGEALVCYGAMSHGFGSIGSYGLQSHTDGGWMTANAVVGADVPAVCGRMAYELIINMGQRRYSKLTFWDVSTPSWNRCTRLDENQNCRLTTRCFQEALRRVCAVKARCCPSYAHHAACSVNVYSDACKDNFWR